MLLEDTYLLEAELGRGGMGTVFRARHTKLDKLVAVKVLNPQLFGTPEALVRFSREAKVAARINHPVMTHVMDYGVVRDHPFIVMEYVPGKTLSEVLYDTRGPLRFAPGLHPTEAIEVMRQLLSLLRNTHALGIVHRDLKPANIKVFADDCQLYVKVLDFGIAKDLDGDVTQLTAEGALVGTPAYMAPEQLTGHPVDGRTDLYAAGLIFHELLSGKPAFGGKTISRILHEQVNEPPPLIEGLPELLQRTLATLLRKRPEERFQDATEADFALARCEEAVRGTDVEVTGSGHRFLVTPSYRPPVPVEPPDPTFIPGPPLPEVPSPTVPPPEKPSQTIIGPAPTSHPSAGKILARIALGVVGVILLLSLVVAAIGGSAKQSGQEEEGTTPSQASDDEEDTAR
jgi:serine/threonine-protein kinase